MLGTLELVFVFAGLFVYCLGTAFYRLSFSSIPSRTIDRLLPISWRQTLDLRDAGLQGEGRFFWQRNRAHIGDHVQGWGIAIALIPVLSWGAILVPVGRGWMFSYWIHIGLDPGSPDYRWSWRRWISEILYRGGLV